MSAPFSFGGTTAAPAPTGGAFKFGASTAPTPAASGFSFGSAAQSPAAPAPAGGFSLGGQTAPAPAPTGGFSFGAKSPSPAPGGFSFGSTAAPAATTSLFGGSTSSAAPAAGNSLFSSAPAPTGGFSFGAKPPAPASNGFSFGSTAAPATSLFGSGSTALPSPATGSSLFSSAPAPATGGFSFGTASAPAGSNPFSSTQTTPGQQQAPITYYTPYSALPDNAKRVIDDLYKQINDHRRTMYHIERMSPALLTLPEAERSIPTIVTPGLAGQKTTPGQVPSPWDSNVRRGTDASNRTVSARTPGSKKPLPHQIRALGSRLQLVSQQVCSLTEKARAMHSEGSQALETAMKEGAWPLEMIAARRGVALTPLSSRTRGTADPALTPQQQQQHEMLQEKYRLFQNQQAATVDWQEPIPSRYMWQLLHKLEDQLSGLTSQVETLSRELSIVLQTSPSIEPDVAAGSPPRRLLMPGRMEEAPATMASKVASVLHSQWDAFIRVAADIARLHDALEALKTDYSLMLTGYHKDSAAPSAGTSPRAMLARGGTAPGNTSPRPRSFSDPFRKADAKELEQEEALKARFAAKVAAASAAPAATTTTAAPSSNAPAPSTGGNLFGPSKPAGSSLFGSAPAPTGNTNLFSGTPAPAPSPGTSIFGSNPAPTPAPGPSLFGSAPAAAALAFGGTSTTPAPASGNLFGSTSNSSLKPKKKSSNSRRR